MFTLSKKNILLLVLVFILSMGCTLLITFAVKNGNSNNAESSSSSQSLSAGQSAAQSTSSLAPDDQTSVQEPDDEIVEADPSGSILVFSDKNANKVIETPTFDVTQYTQNAGVNVRPYNLFSSGACLQREAINRVWGYVSNSVTKIAIELKGKVYYGTVNGTDFEVYLPKMSAGGPYTMTFISDAGRVSVTNVYIGEVFLVSGQSNMEMSPNQLGGVLKELYSTTDCTNEQIRMAQIGWNDATEPSILAINALQWVGANRSSVLNFSATGYIFGKHMQEELGCPVGLVYNAVGGSSLEYWLSKENYDALQEHYTTYTDGSSIMTPCYGYNNRLYPLAGFNFRSVVWYQGESNAFGTQEYYDIALQTYIAQCREMFDNEQLGFTVCELARYKDLPYQYSIVNERINVVAEKDELVVVARNLDQGDWFDIHPKDKREIGRRAAYETLRVFFNKNKPAPVTVTDYQFNQDGSVTIDLSCNASLVNGTNGFEVYVGGRYTYDCNVSINANRLTVTANGEITKVRYGYNAQMTDDVQQDVSKTVTVFDENGFPLDLFTIVNENASDSDLPDAPTLSEGWVDPGSYTISVDSASGDYVIKKAAAAVQWSGAHLAVSDYSSVYTSFTMSFTTQNVSNFTLQMVVTDTTGTAYILLYQKVLTDGEHEITIDFSNTKMLTPSGSEIPDRYIKDCQIDSLVFSLDTAVQVGELIAEEATCTVHDIIFKAQTANQA